MQAPSPLARHANPYIATCRKARPPAHASAGRRLQGARAVKGDRTKLTDYLTRIGGYFELDLPERAFPHAEAILLNNGRSCMTYVFRALDVRHVHVPRFTCDVVLEPMKRLGIGYSFYGIDDDFEIAEPLTLGDGEMLLVNNYFGLKDANCRRLAAEHGSKLMVDCSQAWYFDPVDGAHSFYTPRKFFGVPDGGCLHTKAVLGAALEEDVSQERLSHLIKRFESGAEAGYADFQSNDASLNNQPMRAMSRLTRRLLGLIDHSGAAQRRKANFATLDAELGSSNYWDWSRVESQCPMVYPYRPQADAAELRRKLIDSKIFVATYWPNVLSWCASDETEYRLTAETLFLPIDQRYGPDEMARVVEVLR